MSKYLIRLCLISAICIHAQSIRAATVFSDDFSSDSTALAKTSMVNWNVTQGNIDVVSPGSFGCPNPGTNCVDLDGTSSPLPAIIETKTAFSFTAGQLYELFFDIPVLNTGISGIINDSFTVTIGSFYTETFTDYDVPLAVTRQFTPGSDGSATIEFEMLVTPNNGGPFLTEVTLTLVPVPAAIWLFGSGLLGLIGMARRKQTA